jgi:hypothetical protein
MPPSILALLGVIAVCPLLTGCVDKSGTSTSPTGCADGPCVYRSVLTQEPDSSKTYVDTLRYEVAQGCSLSCPLLLKNGQTLAIPISFTVTNPRPGFTWRLNAIGASELDRNRITYTVQPSTGPADSTGPFTATMAVLGPSTSSRLQTGFGLNIDTFDAAGNRVWTSSFAGPRTTNQ